MASYFRFLFSLTVPVDSFLSSFISHSPSKVCIYNCYKKNSTERWNCISQSILSLSISVLGKSEVKRSRNKAQEKIHQTFWYVTGIIKIPLLAWWKKSSNLKSSHASIVPDCSIDNVTIWCIGNVRQPTKKRNLHKDRQTWCNSFFHLHPPSPNPRPWQSRHVEGDFIDSRGQTRADRFYLRRKVLALASGMGVNVDGGWLRRSSEKFGVKSRIGPS